jgi:hypothetical protein
MALLPELVMVAFASQEVFTHQSRSWKDFASRLLKYLA